jgi:hypothetical protein
MRNYGWHYLSKTPPYGEVGLSTINGAFFEFSERPLHAKMLKGRRTISKFSCTPVFMS